jgi:hypothetical protein
LTFNCVQNTDNNSSIDNLLTEDESLFYGSNSASIIDPEVLFAIGRTKEDEALETSTGRESAEASKTEPLLQ